MSALNRAITELIRAENDWANAALTRPADKSEYGFGHACGMFQGFKEARSILERALADSDPRVAERHRQ